MKPKDRITYAMPFVGMIGAVLLLLILFITGVRRHGYNPTPMPRRGEPLEQYMKRVRADSVSRAYFDSISKTIEWKSEPIKEGSNP